MVIRHIKYFAMLCACVSVCVFIFSLSQSSLFFLFHHIASSFLSSPFIYTLSIPFFPLAHFLIDTVMP